MVRKTNLLKQVLVGRPGAGVSGRVRGQMVERQGFGWQGPALGRYRHPCFRTTERWQSENQTAYLQLNINLSTARKILPGGLSLKDNQAQPRKTVGASKRSTVPCPKPCSVPSEDSLVLAGAACPNLRSAPHRQRRCHCRCCRECRSPATSYLVPPSRIPSAARPRRSSSRTAAARLGMRLSKRQFSTAANSASLSMICNRSPRSNSAITASLCSHFSARCAE